MMLRLINMALTDVLFSSNLLFLGLCFAPFAYSQQASDLGGTNPRFGTSNALMIEPPKELVYYTLQEEYSNVLNVIFWVITVIFCVAAWIFSWFTLPCGLRDPLRRIDSQSLRYDLLSGGHEEDARTSRDLSGSQPPKTQNTRRRRRPKYYQ